MQTSLFLLATNLQNGPVGQAMERGGFERGGRGHGPEGFFPLLILVALALLGIWFWRNRSGRNNLVEATANALHGGADRFKSAFTSTATPAQNPLQTLQTRYASGDISRDEYLTMRADLVGGTSDSADHAEPANPAEAVDIEVTNAEDDDKPKKTK